MKVCHTRGNVGEATRSYQFLSGNTNTLLTIIDFGDTLGIFVALLMKRAFQLDLNQILPPLALLVDWEH
jgi:hypothetical protein